MLTASLKISVQRATSQGFADGLVDAQNLPLLAVIVSSIVLLEAFRKRLSPFTVSLVFLSGLTFFVCSFYLPIRSQTHELMALPAYIAVLILLSSAVVTVLYRRPRIGTILVVFLILSVAGESSGYAYTFSHEGVFSGSPTADAAVVLGGAVWGPHRPSPDLKARLDAAAKLYETGEAERIAVTGGTRRFNTFESEIGAWYLREAGIPASRILTEHKTLNTIEQIRYVKHVLADSFKMKHIVIVSDGWHLPRAMLMCKWENVRATCYASHYRLSLQSELFWRAREAAGLQIYMLFGA